MDMPKLAPHPLLNIRPVARAIWSIYGVPPMVVHAARIAKEEQLFDALKAALDAQAPVLTKASA